MDELNKLQDRIIKLNGEAAKAYRQGRHGAAWSLRQTVKGLWAEYRRKAAQLPKAQVA